MPATLNNATRTRTGRLTPVRVSNTRQAARQAVLSRGLELSIKRRQKSDEQRDRIRACVSSQATSEVADTFSRLAEAWQQATALVSSINEKSMHPAYQQIIGMGNEALPLIFRELANGEPDHWFWALRAITGEDPVSPEHRGDIDAMTRAWLQWARKKHYL